MVDRSKGTEHPRCPGYIYPVNYDYLKDTGSVDDSGIDIWVGTAEK